MSWPAKYPSRPACNDHNTPPTRTYGVKRRNGKCSDPAKAVLSGSGDVSLGVTEQLDVRLSGSGDLSYAGRPQLRQSVSGSGEILRR